jgi:outer membrane protein TolC
MIMKTHIPKSIWRFLTTSVFLSFLALRVSAQAGVPQVGSTQAPQTSAQTSSVTQPGATSTSLPPPGQTQSPFQGSVPTGTATGTVLPLSLRDALARALKYNLGGIEGSENVRAEHAVRLRNLNTLLPQLMARVSATMEQINLKALGLNFSVPGIPTIVGPFGIADARAALSQELFNWADIKNWSSAAESERASQFSYKSDRDLVVLTTGNSYLLVISDGATVGSIRAEVRTARAFYQRAVDQRKAGVIASIDELRAQVELQTQQQRLISAENRLAIDKLTLGRVIGLPNGQDFQVTDLVPYSPLTGITQQQALYTAYGHRPDYLSARSQVHAAELARQAATAENYPTVSVNTDFGAIGSPNFAHSHETFTFAATLNIPVFQGTRVRADKLQADSALRQRRAELEDLRGKIDDQVRTAFLNLKSSSDLVVVAKSNIDLANRTLTQAQDRFSAGVTDNIEVVQAQESVASANQSYIASVYAYNQAKISLAQAMGIAEQSALQYLGGR